MRSAKTRPSSLRRVREEQHELVAAVPGAEVGLAQLLGDGAGDGPDGEIARRVAELVVDRLQVIHVRHDAGEEGAVAAGALHLLVEARAEGAEVGEAGEGIGLRELSEHRLAVDEPERPVEPRPQLLLREGLREEIDRAEVQRPNPDGLVRAGRRGG